MLARVSADDYPHLAGSRPKAHPPARLRLRQRVRVRTRPDPRRPGEVRDAPLGTAASQRQARARPTTPSSHLGHGGSNTWLSGRLLHFRQIRRRSAVLRVLEKVGDLSSLLVRWRAHGSRSDGNGLRRQVAAACNHRRLLQQQSCRGPQPSRLMSSACRSGHSECPRCGRRRTVERVASSRVLGSAGIRSAVEANGQAITVMTPKAIVDRPEPASCHGRGSRTAAGANVTALPTATTANNFHIQVVRCQPGVRRQPHASQHTTRSPPLRQCVGHGRPGSQRAARPGRCEVGRLAAESRSPSSPGRPQYRWL